MITSVKARTPILALILFVFAVGYTFAANKVVVIPMAADAAPLPIVAFSGGDQLENLSVTDMVVRSVVINATGLGTLVVNASGYTSSVSAAGAVTRCSIRKNSTTIDFDALVYTGLGGSTSSPFGATRGFDIVAAGAITINLVCDSTNNNTSTISDSSLTAMFTPSA
jgi:hypothetical protein